MVVRDYERGKSVVSGPLSALVECYLAGCEPPDGIETIRDFADRDQDDDLDDADADQVA